MADVTVNFKNKIKNDTRKSLFPGVPQPTPDLQSLYRTVNALKQGYEQLVRARGTVDDSAVRVSDLEVFGKLLLEQSSQDAEVVVEDAVINNTTVRQTIVQQVTDSGASAQDIANINKQLVDLQDSINDILPIDLYSDDVNDVDNGMTAQRENLLAYTGAMLWGPEYRAQYKAYVPGTTYYPQNIVVNGSYLMVANTVTTEAPTPSSADWDLLYASPDVDCITFNEAHGGTSSSSYTGISEVFGGGSGDDVTCQLFGGTSATIYIVEPV